MATIIRKEGLKENKTYEPPLVIGFGINNKTVEVPKMVMGHTVLPPGRRNRRHYHVNCNVGVYRIKGRARLLLGPGHEQEEFEVGPGDFVFIPAGEIHAAMNLSDKESTEVVFCYVGVNSIEEANTIFVELPLE